MTWLYQFDLEIWQAWIGLAVSAVVGIGLFGANPFRGLGFLRKLVLVIGVAGILFFGAFLIVQSVMPSATNSAMAVEFCDSNTDHSLNGGSAKSSYQRAADAKGAILYNWEDKKFSAAEIPPEYVAYAAKDVKYIVEITYNDSERLTNANGSKNGWSGYYTLKFRDTVTWKLYVVKGGKGQEDTNGNGTKYAYPEPGEDADSLTVGSRPTKNELKEVIKSALEDLD
ncbi:MAG: hypothetical protein LBN42_00875 [Oscillospiraceae bacterium]|jgi:hypothetical protein|nr:hypothetical protein [Oscillospiraceae bacterium]